jgi:hypothetical protein
MDAIKRLDERILALFTKFSHWFQRLTGLTNYFLAKTAVGLFFVDGLAKIANFWFPILNQKTGYKDIFFDGFLCFSGFMLWTWMLNDAEARLQNSAEVKPLVKEVLGEGRGMQLIRVTLFFLCLLSFPFGMYDLATATRGFFIFNLNSHFALSYMFCFLYFLHVDPLPPGTSKVQEWKAAFQAGFRKLNPVRSTG